MRAAIISIGDELMLGQTIDTNTAWLSAELAARGIVTIEHRTIGDDRAALGETVCRLASTVDLLILTGGLGPTADDLTREALADALTPGQALVRDAAAVTRLERWFSTHGSPMPKSNLKQADRPAGTQLLANPHGTALGISGRLGACRVFALPGPPAEMMPMLLEQVLPTLERPASGDVVLTDAVHAYGLGESAGAERLGSLMDRSREPLVGTTVSESILTARIVARGPQASAHRALDQTMAVVKEKWRPFVFGCAHESLASAVGELLRAGHGTLTTAESCTGGLLGKMIVDVAGASDYYLGGWVTYTNELKQTCLAVPADVLTEHGAVSEPTARAMAEGALKASGADYSLAITGIAGPDGETPDKPHGTVFIGLGQVVEGERRVRVRRFAFPGDRWAVRDRSAKSALQMLRFTLLGVSDDTHLLWAVHP